MRAVAAAEPVAEPVPAGFAADGRVDEWASRPPSFTLLPKGEGAPKGRIWVATSAEGLVVAGAVETAAAPRFAKAPADMPNGDHVELWLALSDGFPLPPVGWGHQFADVALEQESDCAKVETVDDESRPACEAWYRAQVKFRQGFARLALRQWQLAPGVAPETYATPAFAAIPAAKREDLAPLKPSGAPAFKAGPLPAGTAGNGYGFETVVPWSAMPPAAALRVERLRVLVDVFGPGQGGKYGPYSTIAAERKFGAVASFPAVALKEPRSFQVSACGQALKALGRRQDELQPAWFLPRDADARGLVSSLFVIENPIAGYQYTPNEQATSPTIVATKLQSKTFPQADLTLCAPMLAARLGRKDIASEQWDQDLASARVKRLAGGRALLVVGPRTTYSGLGTGTCGACPVLVVDVFVIDPKAGIIKLDLPTAFQVPDADEMSGEDRNARLAVTDDLARIKVWESPIQDEKKGWSLTELCLDEAAATYKQCAQRRGVKAPRDVPFPK